MPGSKTKTGQDKTGPFRVIGDGYIDDDIGGDTVGNSNIDGDISDQEDRGKAGQVCCRRR